MTMGHTIIDKTELTALRTSLSSESLKTVDIRVDFSGVPDISPWANIFINTELGSIFKDYKMSVSHFQEYDGDSLEALSILVGIPVSILVKMPMHIFLQGYYPGLEDELTLRLSNVSAQFTIRCKNYKSIDPYLQWIIKFTKVLKIKIGLSVCVGLESAN